MPRQFSNHAAQNFVRSAAASKLGRNTGSEGIVLFQACIIFAHERILRVVIRSPGGEILSEFPHQSNPVVTHVVLQCKGKILSFNRTGPVSFNSHLVQDFEIRFSETAVVPHHRFGAAEVRRVLISRNVEPLTPPSSGEIAYVHPSKSGNEAGSGAE